MLLILLGLFVVLCSSACATFFQHCNYDGTEWVICSDKNSVGYLNANDDWSSVILDNDLDYVTIYQHDNYGGDSKTFYDSDPCFVNDPMESVQSWNDEVSSVKVTGGCATFYQHCNYGGVSKKICGNLGYVGDEWNDEFSSVWFDEDTVSVKVFQHSNYGGDSMEFYNSDACFTNDMTVMSMDWNDQVSSLKLSPSGGSESTAIHCDYYNCNSRYWGANDGCDCCTMPGNSLGVDPDC